MHLSDEEVSNKLRNIELVLNDIRMCPQTYKTILGDSHWYGLTSNKILRRKMNNLLTEGKVFKTVIPGTRFGEVLFYTAEERNYYIMIIKTPNKGLLVLPYTTVTFRQYKDAGDKIILSEYLELKATEWIEHEEEKIVQKVDITKWI